MDRGDENTGAFMDIPPVTFPGVSSSAYDGKTYYNSQVSPINL